MRYLSSIVVNAIFAAFLASYPLFAASNEVNSRIIHHVLTSSISDQISGHTIIDILETIEGEIWISTDSGVSRYRGDELEHFSLASSSTHELFAVALYETRSSNVLAVASDGSIFVYDLELDKLISRNAATAIDNNKNVITSSYLSLEGTLFLADSSGRISAVDADTLKINQIAQFSNSAIVDIIEIEQGLLLTLDSNGAIFSLSFSGEGMFEGKKHSACNAKYTYFTSFDIFRDGSVLLGTSGNGILNYHDGHLSSLLDNNTIYNLAVKGDTIYAGTEKNKAP